MRAGTPSASSSCPARPPGRACAARDLALVAGASPRAISPSRGALPGALQPAADAAVHAQRAGLEDETADEVGVDETRRLDLAAAAFSIFPTMRSCLVVGELDGGLVSSRVRIRSSAASSRSHSS